MADQNKRRQQIVADACRLKVDGKPLPTRTLAKKLHAQYPRLFSSVEVARTTLRYYRGNNGERQRRKVANKSNFRPSGSQSDRPPLPKSLAKPWEPFVLDARRVLSISDLHIPFHDEAAIDAALDYGDRFKPDAILINGDLLDFEALSRFDRPPGGPTTAEELECGRQFFRHLRHRHPTAKIIYSLGNHDERWQLYLWRKAMELGDLCNNVWHQYLGTAECGVEIVGDQRPVMCGKLAVLHGHQLSKGFTSPVNPARGAFLKLIASCLIGHHHRTSEHTERTFDGRIIASRSQGCLCGLWPQYARTNKWDSGLATIEVDSSGDYECRLHRIVNGKIR